MDNPNSTEQTKVENQQNWLSVQPSRHPREGWEEQMRLMADRGDDKLLDGDGLLPTRWDIEEWEW